MEAGPDYESLLSRLWGEETFEQLRDLVKVGEIDDVMVNNFARRVKAVNTFNANRHLNLVEQFERILEFWVNQELFNYQPAKAQDVLTEVLTKARCTNKVVYIIKSKMRKRTDGHDKR